MSNDQIIILDGGMGRELERIGAPFSQPFWSAQALIEAPDTVTQVHRNFINAGAQIITTNSYAVVPPHIGADLFAARGRELIRLSASLARKEANKATKQPVQVAACIPPVFGSYKPDSFDEKTAPHLLTPFFEEQETDADLFLAETISSIQEAQAIIDTYEEFDSSKPLWLAFSLEELFDESSQPNLRSGEKLDEALKIVLEQNIAQAILFNCCAVEDITAAFDLCDKIITKHKNIKFGAYANAFGPVQKSRNPTNSISALREDILPQTYLEYAQKWTQKGANIVGGCCGIGPEYIELLAQELNTAKKV